jgi:hypothetical protein
MHGIYHLVDTLQSMDNTLTYRPLPNYLTIQPSKIEGLGLFTIKDISNLESSIGITHVFFDEKGQIFRTPLGGFINHSNIPNCKVIRHEGSYVNYLYPIKPIKANEELTLKYKMYTIDE